MKVLQVTVISAGLLLVLLTGSGCASAKVLRGEKFVPSAVSVSSRHSELLHIEADCSGACSPYADQAPNGYVPPAVDDSFVSLYRNALAESLRTSQLYRVANKEDESQFVLRVVFLRMSGANGLCGADNETPSGFAILVARWTLTNRLTGLPVCQKDITTSSEHGAPDYILGGMFSAQRNAVEDVAAANIRLGIEWLSRRTQAEK